MSASPECYQFCPRIYDAAEEAAALGWGGVARNNENSKAPAQGIIRLCALADSENCPGPTPEENEVIRREGPFKKMLRNATIYRCGRTGEVSTKVYYRFAEKQGLPPIE
jgi:hypothetical protein